MHERGHDTKSGSNSRRALARTLTDANVTCPICSRKTPGTALETLWRHDVFWQIRLCPHCLTFLVATTPVVGTTPGPTHCARLTLRTD